MVQMKEQNRIPEKELNEMQISNLLDAEFKTLVKELSEDLSSMKKVQSEMKDTLTEIENNLQGALTSVAQLSITLQNKRSPV